MLNMLEAKTHLSRIVELVETGVEPEVVLARNVRPVARIVPLARTQAGKRIGIAKGKFTVPDTIDADEDAIAALFNG